MILAADAVHRVPYVTEHAQERTAQRFGRNPELVYWQRAVLDITGGHAMLLSRVDYRRERWLVTLGSIEVAMVWDLIGARIVTVMYADRRDFRHQSPLAVAAR